MNVVKLDSLFRRCCFQQTGPSGGYVPLAEQPPPPPAAATLSEYLSVSLTGSYIHAFTFKELRQITRNFSRSNFLGGGKCGGVHKGFIHPRLLRPGLKAQPVAVKRLHLGLGGSQGDDAREWLTKGILRGQLRHPNLVKLIGYCCEDDLKLYLVYEYMPRGGLDNNLFPKNSGSLPWSTRMKIALGAAKGLAFLHQTEKPIIFQEFKGSNILLDSEYNAKLSDFECLNDGPQVYIDYTVFGRGCYLAPESCMTGRVTSASNVYSFGVVLLELLTGQRATDMIRMTSRLEGGICLANWVFAHVKVRSKLRDMIDPRLEGMYSDKGARVAALVACSCRSYLPKSRPTMSAVVATLEALPD